jgi:sec-independent protein translocase protein TatB
MFDVGIWEIAVIGVVALVVLGPERLPKVARTAGHLFGRLQRYVAQVKSDINREMEAAELGNMKKEIESAARSFKEGVEKDVAETGREMRAIEATIDKQLREGESASAVASHEASAPPPSPQLELGIEEPAQSPARTPQEAP